MRAVLVSKSVANAEAEEPPVFTSLPVDLLYSVAEKLDAHSLAIFAAACSACRAVAHEPLREALLEVLKRCLEGIHCLDEGIHMLPTSWDRDQPHVTSAWETETFKGCSKNLKSLLLGSDAFTDVTSVGSYAFIDCRSLSRCVLPSGLVIIGTGAFERCTSLAELTLPATLTSIGNYALSGCSALTSLTFPASLTTIGLRAFDGCSSLTNVDFSAVTDANIGQAVFNRCERLVKLTLPAALSTINAFTFSGCSALVELTLPTALTSIGTRAFSDCTSLTTLIVPAASQLTHVGEEAQGHLDAPTETRLLMTPSTPVAGEFAFDRCTSLAKLVVHDGLLPKDLREARTRTTIDLLHRLLKRSGVKPVPKAAKLAWPVPDTLASIGRSASRVDPQLAEQLPNQPRRLHYCYRRVRLLLHQVCKSELEIWISELEI